MRQLEVLVKQRDEKGGSQSGSEDDEDLRDTVRKIAEHKRNDGGDAG